MFLSFSSELIAVLDYLAQKLGIAIDWTNENVMPYLKDLSARFIEHEILHGYLVVIGWAAFLLLFTCWLIPTHIIAKRRHEYSWDYLTCWVAGVAWVGFIICLLGTLIAAIYEGFHILECYKMPEKVIIDYIQGLIENTK